MVGGFGGMGESGKYLFVVTVLLNIFLGFTDKILKAESAEKKKDR